jgi:hypothetical protein
VPEPEGSSPRSQQPVNGPYPEPSESTPHPPNQSSKINSNPILPSTPWSSQWFLSLGLSHQNPVHASPLSHACHMLHPPHSVWFQLSNDIWGWVQIMKLPTVQLSPFSRYFIPLRSKYSPQHQGWAICFVTSLCFYGAGFLAPPPNPQAGIPPPPPFGCRRLLIQYIRRYPPYLEAVSSIRNLTTRHAVVTGSSVNIRVN